MKFWKLGIALAMSALLSHVARAEKTPQIPVADFFKKSEFSQMAISPDGRRLAALAPFKKRYNLFIVDLEKRTANRPTSIEEQDISSFVWVSNERIVFTMDKDGNESFGLYAVNVDGSKGRVLVEAPENRGGLPRASSVFKVLRDGSDEILVAANDRVLEFTDVYRMNINTGRKTLVTFDNPGRVTGWVADQKGVVRVAISSRDSAIPGTLIYYRDDEKMPWKKLAEFNLRDPSWTPVDFDYDNKTMYVVSNIGRDTAALYEFDFAKNEPGKLLFESNEVDVTAPIMSEARKKLVGVRYETDKPRFFWFDKDYESLQKLIDQALPKSFNVMAGESLDSKKMLVSSGADTDPGRYYLLDTAKRTMEALPDRRSWIKPAQMAEMKSIKYKTRDGLTLNAYLTLPAGSDGKNLPLIVNPHGGPWARDSWGYNPEIQFLANRGFAVLQPQFRGSTGFGRKLIEASYNQWGLTMQDDITDAVQWAITEGIADPKRVGIYGASYGGYATLMGLIKTPELYQWGINYVGVTSIQRHVYNANWGKEGEKQLKLMVGDPEKDKEKYDAVSPIAHADKIRVPLFMAYGGADFRVPPVQGEDMRKALDKAGKPYEWMIKENEGHGYRKEENTIDFYTKMDEFLKKNAK